VPGWRAKRQSADSEHALADQDLLRSIGIPDQGRPRVDRQRPLILRRPSKGHGPSSTILFNTPIHRTAAADGGSSSRETKGPRNLAPYSSSTPFAYVPRSSASHPPTERTRSRKIQQTGEFASGISPTMGLAKHI